MTTAIAMECTPMVARVTAPAVASCRSMCRCEPPGGGAVGRAPSMTFCKHVIQPALHAQKDAAQNGEVVPVFGVGGNLRGRARRQLVPGKVIQDIDNRQGATGGLAALFGIQQCAGWL